METQLPKIKTGKSRLIPLDMTEFSLYLVLFIKAQEQMIFMIARASSGFHDDGGEIRLKGVYNSGKSQIGIKAGKTEYDTSSTEQNGKDKSKKCC